MYVLNEFNDQHGKKIVNLSSPCLYRVMKYEEKK